MTDDQKLDLISRRTEEELDALTEKLAKELDIPLHFVLAEVVYLATQKHREIKPPNPNIGI